MEEEKIYRLHPAFYRAMSDVSYFLDVAIMFCADEFTRKELMGVHDDLGKLYSDLLDKIKVNIESDANENSK